MNEKKTRKLSVDTFNIKLKKAKRAHKIRLKTINSKYKSSKTEAKTAQDLLYVKRSKKIALQKESNKYALRYNALVNEELYRKGVLEAKIEQEKNKFKKTKEQNLSLIAKKKNNALILK